MLSQKNELAAHPAAVEDTFPMSAVSNDDEAAVQALMDVIQGEQLFESPITMQTLITFFRAATPEFGMAHDHAEFLTSPQFLTSPLESPWDDFLPTPAMGAELEFSPDILTSPAMDFEVSFGDMPLFDDMPLFNDAATSAYKQPVAVKTAPQVVPPTGFENLLTLSPDTPALDPSSLQTSPAIVDGSSFNNSEPPSAVGPNSSRRKPGPTGTRKNVTPETLIPLDAPIQTRNYLTPSATSRKDVPATFARKRSRASAGLDDEPMPQVPLDATEEEAIKIKRLQNTLAARRSRKRKLEYQKQLEDELDGEREQKDGWRARAKMLESLLVSHGIETPPVDSVLA
jgi:hypothetical protein